jgi:hypothetical protein
MTEVTQILHAVAAGDPSAASQLLPLVYDELRQLAAQKLAREAAGQTLQPTARFDTMPAQSASGGIDGNRRAAWEARAPVGGCRPFRPLPYFSSGRSGSVPAAGEYGPHLGP